MKNKTLEEIIKECPKTFENYKKWILNKVKKEFNVENIKNSLLLTSIKTSPYSLTHYFDSIDLIGTMFLDYMTSRFEITVNGVAIEDTNESDKNTFINLGSTDRKEAEELLIKYLFLESEKTL